MTQGSEGPVGPGDPGYRKYPFEDDRGRWTLRNHIPYEVAEGDRTHRLVVRIYAAPEVRARMTDAVSDGTVRYYDDLSDGDVLEIAGDSWTLSEIIYKTHIVLERQTP